MHTHVYVHTHTYISLSCWYFLDYKNNYVDSLTMKWKAHSDVKIFCAYFWKNKKAHVEKIFITFLKQRYFEKPALEYTAIISLVRTAPWWDIFIFSYLFIHFLIQQVFHGNMKALQCWKWQSHPTAHFPWVVYRWGDRCEPHSLPVT